MKKNKKVIFGTSSTSKILKAILFFIKPVTYNRYSKFLKRDFIVTYKELFNKRYVISSKDSKLKGGK